MTLHFTDVYHTGYVVADIAAAMDELGEALAIRWAKPQEREMRLRTPKGVITPTLRYTYSAGDGPTRVELLERVDGTLWELSSGPGRLHHFGLWVSDLQAESDRLLGLGAELQVTYDSDAPGVTGFAYHRLPSGLLLELVDESRRPVFEEWFAGGDLPGYSPEVVT